MFVCFVDYRMLCGCTTSAQLLTVGIGGQNKSYSFRRELCVCARVCVNVLTVVNNQTGL